MADGDTANVKTGLVGATCRFCRWGDAGRRGRGGKNIRCKLAAMSAVPDCCCNEVPPPPPARARLGPLRLAGLPKTSLLLGGRAEDRLLDEPALALQLDDAEVDDLRGGLSVAAAATSIGPAGQDKLSNQDFALAGRGRDHAGGPVVIAVVADGVVPDVLAGAIGTACRPCRLPDDTFGFSRRADRIGTAGPGLARPPRGGVAGRPGKRPRIASGGGHHAGGLGPAVFQARVGQADLWYNTTLLAGVFARAGGIVMFAGDGGVVLRRDGAGGSHEVKVALQSSDDLAIATYVSLGVTEQDFTAAHIALPAGTRRADLILASDGVDRTLQRRFGVEATAQAYLSLDLANARSASSHLDRLCGWDVVEQDNLSVARISWPIDAKWRPAHPAPVAIPPPRRASDPPR